MATRWNVPNRGCGVYTHSYPGLRTGYPNLVTMMKTTRERRLYPLVQRWVKRHFRCFRAEVNRGLIYGRIDVIGVRDVGGELSGDVETIAVEVKKGTAPFGTASGQTLGYNVYVNRVYLADERDKSFSPDELQIASHLGIGLIQVRAGQCKEVLSSPFYNPIPKLNLALLEKLRLGKCQLCDCFFETSEVRRGRRYSKVTTENIKKAENEEKGVRFFLHDIDWRKRKTKYYSERRFICPDCVYSFFSKLPQKA